MPSFSCTDHSDVIKKEKSTLSASCNATVQKDGLLLTKKALLMKLTFLKTNCD